MSGLNRFILTSDLHYGFESTTKQKLINMFKEINERDPDVFIIAGDIACNKFDQFKQCLLLAREYIKETPILIVRGNHDLWGNGLTLDYLFEKQEELCRQLKIINLHNEKNYKYGDVEFFGFDGWYGIPEVPHTNDSFNIKLQSYDCYMTFERVHAFLQKRNDRAFEAILNKIEKSTANTKILVSHMPIFEHPTLNKNYNGPSSYWEFIKGKITIFLYGHTHQFMNEIIDKTTVLNAGSDYDNPKYIEFDNWGLVV